MCNGLKGMLLLLIGLCAPKALLALDADLDPAFNSGGALRLAFDVGGDNRDRPLGIFPAQSGGFWVLSSSKRSFDDVVTIGIKRLRANGSIDTSYGNLGQASVLTSMRSVSSAISTTIAGVFLVVGTSDIQATTNVTVVRIGVNGTLDSLFGSSGYANVDFGADEEGIDIVQIPGVAASYYVLGRRAGLNGASDLLLFRLDAFGSQGGFSPNIYDLGTYYNGGNPTVELPGELMLDSSGRPVVACKTYSLSGNSNDFFCAARFNATGGRDTSYGGGDGVFVFDPGTVAPGSIFAPRAVIDSSNRVTLAATMNDDSLPYRSIVVTRFTADGGMDNTFGNGGSTNLPRVATGQFLTTVGGMALDSQGRILIAYGQSETFSERARVTRLRTNGLIGSEFSNSSFGRDYGFPNNFSNRSETTGPIEFINGAPILATTGRMNPIEADADVAVFRLFKEIFLQNGFEN